MPSPNFRIIATIGDPASIGAEVATKAIADILLHSKGQTKITLIGSEKVIREQSSFGSLVKKPDSFEILDLQAEEVFEAGKPSFQSAERALRDLSHGIDLALKEPQHTALVTGPVDKAWCAKVEPNFRGQTEFLMQKSGAKSVCMLLESPQMKVALATNHLALREVPTALTQELIEERARLFYEYLTSFEEEPHLAVSALNPHASDNGLLGDEEEICIIPAIEALRKKGLKVSGPHSADTLFFRHQEYSGILAMYHDQALIPVKTHGFFEAINISLGLPFLRTSVDHGTGFDLVGKNEASAQSYKNALLAAEKWIYRFEGQSKD